MRGMAEGEAIAAHREGVCLCPEDLVTAACAEISVEITDKYKRRDVFVEPFDVMQQWSKAFSCSAVTAAPHGQPSPPKVRSGWSEKSASRGHGKRWSARGEMWDLGKCQFWLENRVFRFRLPQYRTFRHLPILPVAFPVACPGQQLPIAGVAIGGLSEEKSMSHYLLIV
eukprot:1159894-Pelagomonas_calceolata.AAC.2